ncbi:MAG: hypothetical protein HYT87_14265 [Nitrospirae bacterium]|nr:hypothetical protein [Nitrospirota bacterium]
MKELLGLPFLASANGGEVDRLIVWVHWLMAVLFIGWSLFFIYMLIRFRRSRNAKANYHGLKSHASSYAEVAVAIAEVILLVGFSIPFWSQRVDALPSRTEAVVVRVVAEQFAWNIHYPGADGRFGPTRLELVDATTNPLGLDRSDPMGQDDIVTLNQLHLPVNQPVIVELASKDVIHSFMLNEMRVKQDALPGIVIPVWFTPSVTTADMRQAIGNDKANYEIACAQLCGIGHARMRGFLTIHTQEEFAQWLADNAPSTDSDSASDSFWE